METADILRILGRRGLVILGMALVGVVVAGFTQLTLADGGLRPKTSKYQVRTKILFDLPGAEGEEANMAGARLIFVPFTMAEIVQSEAIAAAASRRVGSAYTPEEVMKGITATGVAPTQLLQIDVRADSPADAVALSKAVTAAFQDWIDKRQDAANVPELNRMSVEPITEPAEKDATPATLAVTKWLIFGLVIGLTIGVVFSFGLPTPEPRPRKRRGRGAYKTTKQPTSGAPAAIRPVRSRST